MRWVLLVLLFLPGITFGSIVITEVMCNPEGSDTDGEWVKVENIGTETIDITGWKFNDGSNHNLNIPPENGGVGSMQISPGQSVLLANKASEVSGESTIIDTVMSLSNSGDTLKLVDSIGTEVHSITYLGSDVVEGESCFNYDSTATTTEAGSAEEVHTNIITTVSEVTKYRTVEIQPPQDITIREIDDAVVLVGSNVQIMPEVYDATGRVVSPKCHITFGDGTESNVCSSSHIYEFAGMYTVHMSAKKNKLQDTETFTIEVQAPHISIAVAEGDEYIEIYNHSEAVAELNEWRLKVDYKNFSIPSSTIIEAQSSIKISSKTVEIDIAKYGGVVRLLNALGNTVADSSEFRAQEPDVTVEAAEDLSEEQVIIKEEVVVKEELVSIPVASIQTSKSIIGMQVQKQKADIQGAPSDSLVNSIDISSKTQQNSQYLTSVASVNIPGVSWNISDILPQEFGKWFIGLLALLGIASVPVLMSKGEDQLQESRDDADGTDNDRVEGFTIEEIK